MVSVGGCCVVRLLSSFLAACIPSECGILVYREETSRVTKRESFGRLLSVESFLRKSVVSLVSSLSHLAPILRQHYHILQDSDSCKEAFPQPPMLCNRRPKSLKEYLVRARLKRSSTGAPRGIIRNCGKNCITCTHIHDGATSVTFTNTGNTYDIRQQLDCNSNNVIYLIQCIKCITDGR